MDNDPARQQALLRAFDDIFRQRLKVAFDGSPAHPAIDYSVSPPADGTSPAVATIRLTGDDASRGAPPDLELRVDLRVMRADRSGATVPDHPATEWLEGGRLQRTGGGDRRTRRPPSGSRLRAAT